MEKIVKRRKNYIMLAILIFAFLVMIMAGDLLMFVFENQVNANINTLDDSFRSLETIFKISGHQAVYPVTSAGRILALIILFLSIILLVMFAAQVFAILNSLNWKKAAKKISQEIDEEQEEVLEELEETQEMESEILRKQKQILQHEQNIMEKLDRLQEEKKD